MGPRCHAGPGNRWVSRAPPAMGTWRDGHRLQGHASPGRGRQGSQPCPVGLGLCRQQGSGPRAAGPKGGAVGLGERSCVSWIERHHSRSAGIPPWAPSRFPSPPAPGALGPYLVHASWPGGREPARRAGPLLPQQHLADGDACGLRWEEARQDGAHSVVGLGPAHVQRPRVEQQQDDGAPGSWKGQARSVQSPAPWHGSLGDCNTPGPNTSSGRPVGQRRARGAEHAGVSSLDQAD